MRIIVLVLVTILIDLAALVVLNPNVSLNYFINKHEHVFTDTVVEATCVSKGYVLHTCSDCGYKMSDNVTDAVPDAHDWQKPVLIDSTCSNAGSKTYVCAHCKEQRVEEIATKSHKFSEWISIMDPTCSEEGLEERICMECEFIENRAIDALGHTWSDGIVADPTCEKEGYTLYSCFVCSEEKSEDITAKVDHMFSDWTLVNHSTCDEYGLEERTCMWCNSSETREVDMHDLTVDQADATCTTHGYVIIDCNACPFHNVSYTEPLGHSYSKWTDVEGFANLEERVCSSCGNIEIRDKE